MSTSSLFWVKDMVFRSFHSNVALTVSHSGCQNLIYFRGIAWDRFRMEWAVVWSPLLDNSEWLLKRGLPRPLTIFCFK